MRQKAKARHFKGLVLQEFGPGHLDVAKAPVGMPSQGGSHRNFGDRAARH
jgi:hypothetical protein